jgi:hypothetical protein
MMETRTVVPHSTVRWMYALGEQLHRSTRGFRAWCREEAGQAKLSELLGLPRQFRYWQLSSEVRPWACVALARKNAPLGLSARLCSPSACPASSRLVCRYLIVRTLCVLRQADQRPAARVVAYYIGYAALCAILVGMCNARQRSRNRVSMPPIRLGSASLSRCS